MALFAQKLLAHLSFFSMFALMSATSSTSKKLLELAANFKKTFMHLEDQIKLIDQKINLLSQNQQILINKLDLVLKGKVTKEEFSLEEKDYATIKELAYHKKKSIRTIFNYLALYKNSIKRKKVEGVRDHLVNIIDFNNAWEKGNTSLTREVFNLKAHTKTRVINTPKAWNLPGFFYWLHTCYFKVALLKPQQNLGF